MNSPNLHGEAFNFGPSSDQNYCVKDVIEEVAKGWPKARWRNKTSKKYFFYEAGLLKLNCDKALHFKLETITQLSRNYKTDIRMV